MSYRYHYTGKEQVHLPELHILTDPNDPEKVYEMEVAINHPDFKEVVKKAEEPVEEKKKGK